jgi:hypothetical protein
MKPEQLSQLSDQELNETALKLKKAYDVFKVLIGLMIAIAIFTTFRKGFSFFTLFPLFFIPLLIANWMNYNNAAKEIETRKSK